MTDHRAVLVTGVADYWGGRVARRLLEEPVNHVIGIDDKKPEEEIRDLDFIQVDVRNPIFDELLGSESVEAVIHLKFDARPERDGGVSNLNFTGTKNVLEACRKVSINRVIVKSSTSIYGAKANNPGFLGENAPRNANRRYGYIRDWLDLEAYYEDFSTLYPGQHLTILRFANIVGLTADTPMNRFLKMRPPLTLLGFDPMLQIVHEDDVVEALVYALDVDYSGPCNVAAEDPMPLSRILRLAGRVQARLFHRFAYKWYTLLESTQFNLPMQIPIEWDYLRYRCVADLRRMEQELSFTPAFRAEEALRMLAEGNKENGFGEEAGSPSYDIDGLRETLRIRQQKRKA